ncbi:MAG: serine hydrolase domain-containing protein, partial [Gaiellaceae bacterium]
MSVVTEKTGLQERLDELREKHGVPGASLAVLANGEIAAAASGLLNLGTGVEATTDSLFQIGSITKVWTATLVMQLVDEGRVGLDDPVRRFLPDFRVADEAVAEQVT